jgi:hypothetical protein
MRGGDDRLFGALREGRDEPAGMVGGEGEVHGAHLGACNSPS